MTLLSRRTFRVSLLASAALLGAIPTDGRAQANFIIPADSITDFQYYDRIETCYALSNRMTDQLARKQDSITIKQEIFLPRPVDTTSELLRWSVQQCMQKFDVSSLAEHDSVTRGKTIVDKALRLYYEGKHRDRFLTVVDSLMRPSTVKDSGYHAYEAAFESVRNAILSIKPGNFALIDSLEDRYVVPAVIKDKRSENLRAAYTYYKLMLKRVDRLYEDSTELGLQAYQQWVTKIQTDIGPQIEGDTSSVVRDIRRLIRSAYDKINYTAALDSLRQRGPDGYFNALEVNHKLAGFTTKRDFVDGVTSPMMTPLAFAAYRFSSVDGGKIQGKMWQASNPKGGRSMTNIEYPLGPAGQPYLVFMMNALCRAEHKNLMGNLRFRARTRECWQQYSYIKWFHEEYPKIPITILTKTVGHFDELATADPYREAEIIKNSWWGFHHLPANIVIYHLNYFTMPGLDQRREDVADENFLRYLKIPGTNQDIRDVNDIPVTLVGPDGRILATMPYHWNAVKKTKEIVDPFYTWYQQKSRSTFDRLSDAKHESDENRHSGVR